MTDQPDHRPDARADAEAALTAARKDVAHAEDQLTDARIRLDAAIAAMLASGATWAQVRELAQIPHRGVQRALYRVDGRALAPVIRDLTVRRVLAHPDFQWLHNPVSQKSLDAEKSAQRLIDAANGRGEEIGWVYMYLVERFGSRPVRPAARDLN